MLVANVVNRNVPVVRAQDDVVSAVGLLLGLVAVRPLGIAAAIGLVLFFAGALAAHVRARAFHNIAAPGIFFALAVAALGLAMAAR